MFCSVIIPTVGRATLQRAVQSVLTQTAVPGGFEVVVVNDSATLLLASDWLADERIQVLNTQGLFQCVARNTGAAVAKGDYLLFLDDDDWLAPEALYAFWQLAQAHPAAGVLCGAFEQNDENGQVLNRTGLDGSGNYAIQFVSGVWMQVAAMLMRADAFFAVGGFSPEFRISDEIDLFNRMTLDYDVGSMPTVVAHVLRGAGWQTTMDYALVYENNRRARDIALSQPGAFRRLRASARDGYWHGRLLRLYLTATVWNVRRRRLFTGLSRGVYAAAALLLAGPHLLTRRFWHGVGDDVPQLTV